jgi:hypothetical protein
MRTIFRVLVPTSALIVFAATAALAQTAHPPSHPKPSAAKSTGAKAPAAAIDAKLVDPEMKAQKKAATVTVKVTGVAIIDPASVGEKPKNGQGHLHYRVDDGPVIATTATKLTFHELKPGPHKIEVVLAGNDHNPLGPQQILNVTVPGNATTNSH